MSPEASNLLVDLEISPNFFMQDIIEQNISLLELNAVEQVLTNMNETPPVNNEKPALE